MKFRIHASNPGLGHKLLLFNYNEFGGEKIRVN
jgi:hypothetical protein